MGDSLKKFLQNKNTVTVVCVVLAILIIYGAYNWRVKSAINPISVPYAIEQISPGTQIKSEMVGTREVPPSMIDEDVIKNKSSVIDKYSSADTIIPAGSLFYERTVVEKEQLPGNIILEYPKNYVLFNLSVTTDSTYGNSVYPGNYIDVWVKAVNKLSDDELKSGQVRADANAVMYSRLVKNIKVLAVKDSSGNAVFSNLDEEKTPSQIIFAVPEEMFVLLKKVENMQTYETSIELVPTNESLKKVPEKEKIESELMVEWINRHTVWDPANG